MILTYKFIYAFDKYLCHEHIIIYFHIKDEINNYDYKFRILILHAYNLRMI